MTPILDFQQRLSNFPALDATGLVPWQYGYFTIDTGVGNIGGIARAITIYDGVLKYNDSNLFRGDGSGNTCSVECVRISNVWQITIISQTNSASDGTWVAVQSSAGVVASPDLVTEWTYPSGGSDAGATLYKTAGKKGQVAAKLNVSGRLESYVCVSEYPAVWAKTDGNSVSTDISGNVLFDPESGVYYQQTTGLPTFNANTAQLFDAYGVNSLDGGSRITYDVYGTQMFSWANDFVVSAPAYFNDGIYGDGSGLSGNASGLNVGYANNANYADNASHADNASYADYTGNNFISFFGGSYSLSGTSTVFLLTNGDGSGLTGNASGFTVGSADYSNSAASSSSDFETFFDSSSYTLSGNSGVFLLTNGDGSGLSGVVHPGGTGTVIAGTKSATGTATTTFTVTIGSTMANTSYKVATEPLNALSAAMNYVTNKTTTTFDVVYLTGLTGAVAFDWIITP